MLTSLPHVKYQVSPIINPTLLPYQTIEDFFFPVFLISFYDRE